MEEHGGCSSIVASRIRSQMDKIGVNARELAEKASVGKSFVYDILSGKSSNPTSKKLMAIAEVLQVPLAYLVGSDDGLCEVASGGISPISYLEDEGVDGSIKYEKFYVPANTKLPFHTEHLRFYDVKGDSMSPTLFGQDIVLVDISDKVAHPAGVFAIKDSIGILIRRLEYIRDSSKIVLHVVCDNKKYSSYECAVEDIEILGRVIWYARALR
ncbi:ECH_1013 family putative transcriptional regulator [Anaplasma phagocytophilum]|uniref:DNA-binding protein n=5 Tax=Anaplasma phagocytophilum TaxID=948 RepID=Q2GJ03_ANAPZ|nr:LexA family transcriptional regulator [Anaplasma phagocytophilum]KJZ98643.1 helix-turn-helix family protein [Anaplasma phagocytophilum str. CR1007]ABD43247.1 DNA-binding protein [Anaplasma phagocytophilum str. HZ]AGR79026.1 DNA-binding protein [Anaplasma phagocytophilum str. HZ2]AGR80273.1 DNA-binding protein [Anaplasma phagocytophilum str. JM]AGR81527.1 DNA-binding protein [Anaplasma phagocytophilum str. Dog2]